MYSRDFRDDIHNIQDVNGETYKDLDKEILELDIPKDQLDIWKKGFEIFSLIGQMGKNVELQFQNGKAVVTLPEEASRQLKLFLQDRGNRKDKYVKNPQQLAKRCAKRYREIFNYYNRKNDLKELTLKELQSIYLELFKLSKGEIEEISLYMFDKNKKVFMYDGYYYNISNKSENAVTLIDNQSYRTPLGYRKRDDVIDIPPYLFAIQNIYVIADELGKTGKQFNAEIIKAELKIRKEINSSMNVINFVGKLE